MTGTRPWISVHVFYDGDLDLVITDLLATVQDRLDAAAAGAGLFFLRYWEGGPHLRIRALPAPGRADDVRRILSVATGDFLCRLPAPTRATQADYDRYAPAMAALEELPSYERDLRPNNSFAFIPYRPETGTYGTGASLHATEDHFVRCSGAVRRLLATQPSRDRRTTAAFATLALNRWIATGRPEPGTPSWPPGGEAEARYERRRSTLLAIAERTRALAENPPEEPSGFAGALAASATTLAGRIGEPGAVRDVLGRCAHLTCNRLGVSLTEESWLRDLADRTFAELARDEAAA